MVWISIVRMSVLLNYRRIALEFSLEIPPHPCAVVEEVVETEEASLAQRR